jgi:hypothetical protein
MYAAITGVSRGAAVVNVTVKVATGRTHPDLVGRH